MDTIYDFKALTSNGKELDFNQFRGKVLLIVNTASKCGFTPQFAAMAYRPLQSSVSWVLVVPLLSP